MVGIVLWSIALVFGVMVAGVGTWAATISPRYSGPDAVTYSAAILAGAALGLLLPAAWLHLGKSNSLGSASSSALILVACLLVFTGWSWLHAMHDYSDFPAGWVILGGAVLGIIVTVIWWLGQALAALHHLSQTPVAMSVNPSVSCRRIPTSLCP